MMQIRKQLLSITCLCLLFGPVQETRTMEPITATLAFIGSYIASGYGIAALFGGFTLVNGVKVLVGKAKQEVNEVKKNQEEIKKEVKLGFENTTNKIEELKKDYRQALNDGFVLQANEIEKKIKRLEEGFKKDFELCHEKIDASEKRLTTVMHGLNNFLSQKIETEAGVVKAELKTMKAEIKKEFGSITNDITLFKKDIETQLKNIEKKHDDLDRKVEKGFNNTKVQVAAVGNNLEKVKSAQIALTTEVKSRFDSTDKKIIEVGDKVSSIKVEIESSEKNILSKIEESEKANHKTLIESTKKIETLMTDYTKAMDEKDILRASKIHAEMDQLKKDTIQTVEANTQSIKNLELKIVSLEEGQQDLAKGQQEIKECLSKKDETIAELKEQNKVLMLQMNTYGTTLELLQKQVQQGGLQALKNQGETKKELREIKQMLSQALSQSNVKLIDFVLTWPVDGKKYSSQIPENWTEATNYKTNRVKTVYHKIVLEKTVPGIQIKDGDNISASQWPALYGISEDWLQLQGNKWRIKDKQKNETNVDRMMYLARIRVLHSKPTTLLLKGKRIKDEQVSFDGFDKQPLAIEMKLGENFSYNDELFNKNDVVVITPKRLTVKEHGKPLDRGFYMTRPTIEVSKKQPAMLAYTNK